MMTNFKKSMKRRISLLSEWNEEEYGFSKGCCYFHDEDELKSFNDIEDDEEVEESKYVYNDEELENYF